MNWLKDTAEQWSRVTEATKPLLEMPEANLDTSDPESLLFDETEEPKPLHIMNEKINEIRNYFKYKLLAGEFEIDRFTQHQLTLKIDGYEFTIWIGNMDIPNTRDQYGPSNFMQLDLNKEERIKLDGVLQPLIAEKYNATLREEKMKSYLKLKEELNIT